MHDPTREPSPDPREILRPWLGREPDRPAAAARERVAALLGARHPRPAFALGLVAAAGLALWLTPRVGSPPPAPETLVPATARAPVAEARTLVFVLSSGTRLVVPLDPAP